MHVIEIRKKFGLYVYATSNTQLHLHKFEQHLISTIPRMCRSNNYLIENETNQNEIEYMEIGVPNSSPNLFDSISQIEQNCSLNFSNCVFIKFIIFILLFAIILNYQFVKSTFYETNSLDLIIKKSNLMKSNLMKCDFF